MLKTSHWLSNAVAVGRPLWRALPGAVLLVEHADRAFRFQRTRVLDVTSAPIFFSSGQMRVRIQSFESGRLVNTTVGDMFAADATEFVSSLRGELDLPRSYVEVPEDELIRTPRAFDGQWLSTEADWSWQDLPGQVAGAVVRFPLDVSFGWWTELTRMMRQPNHQVRRVRTSGLWSASADRTYGGGRLAAFEPIRFELV